MARINNNGKVRGGKSEELGLGGLFVYSLPAIPVAALGLPLYVYLPPFYTELGISAAVVGIIFMFARFWDVFTDPVMAGFFDRYKTRWGRRRLWIAIATPVLMLSTYMLFVPGENTSPWRLGFWLFIHFIAWTMIYISHLSWGGELSDDYHRRSVIQGVREGLSLAGSIMVLIAPAIIQFTGAGEQFDRRMFAMAMFIIITFPLCSALAVYFVKERPEAHHGEHPAAESWRESIMLFMHHHALRRIVIADLALGVSLGTVAGLFIFMARDVLQLGRFTDLLVIVYFLSGIIFLPLMLKLADILGKNRALACSCLFNTVTVSSLLILPPGMPVAALLLWGLLGINVAASPTLLRSIIADIAEHDAVLTGARPRTGLFYAFLTMTVKIGAAVAIGLTYVALEYVLGFQSGPEHHQNYSHTGLRWIYVGVAISMNALVIGLVWNFPLGREEQEKNRLAMSERHSTAVSPAD